MKEPERYKHRSEFDDLPPEDAENLGAIMSALELAPAPRLRQNHKEQLLALLEVELPQPKTQIERLREWFPVALLLSQARIIQREIWLASALVIVIGVVMRLASPTDALHWYTALAPVAAAVGVATIYDRNVQLMLELEETTLASARLLLLARLTWVFSFNLLIATCGSIVLAVLDSQMSLMPLILSWLAPMAFLSGLAFFLAVVLADPLAAALFSLSLWMVNQLVRVGSLQGIWLYLQMPGLTDPSNRLTLILAAVCIVCLALVALGLQERQIGDHS